jgi:succinyl-diaminopimelate desuccinylase
MDGPEAGMDLTTFDLTTFIDTAVELLAVPSTADRPDQLRRALDLTVDFVGPGFVVDRFESRGMPSALLRLETPERPAFRVILNGHLDVVPADAEQFVPRLVGERLYARGAQDMKVSALVLAQVFRELAARLPFPLALQLVTDEEVGGRDGTLHQIEQGVTGAFVVIGEHSGLDIVADSKGMLHATLTATGRGGHGAYPLARRQRPGEDRQYPEPAAGPLPGRHRGGMVWRTTVNVARVQTPNQAINQTPARAQAWLDIRFPAEDVDLNGRAVAEVADYLGSFCDPGVEVEIDQLDPPQHADHDRPEIAALRLAAQHQGYRGGFLRKHGAGDGGFYSGHGIAAVAFGVGGAGQHGPQEYADLPTIAPYHRALTEFLTSLDGVET